MNNLAPAAQKRVWWLLMAAFLGGLAYWLATLVTVFAQDRQIDFKDYYYGVKAFQAGANPYTKEGLEQAAGGHVAGRFLYPPIVLHLFAPLVALGLSGSYVTFVILKVIVLAGVLFLWGKYFKPPDTSVLWVLALAMHAFGRPFVIDLRVGNISTFEELGLWVAFYCFLRGWYWRFSLLIAATAAFKLTPVVFLALTLLVGNRRAVVAGVTAGVLFLGVVLNPLLYGDHLLAEFFRASLSQDERGALNPCMLSLIRDVGDAVASPLVTASGFSRWAYLVHLGLVTGAGALIWFHRRREWQPVELLMLFSFVYALCVPRFKNYSYALMIIPALYVLAVAVRAWPWRIILLALMCVHVFHHQQVVTVALLYLLLLAHYWRLPVAASKAAAENVPLTGAVAT